MIHIKTWITPTRINCFDIVRANNFHRSPSKINNDITHEKRKFLLQHWKPVKQNPSKYTTYRTKTENGEEKKKYSIRFKIFLLCLDFDVIYDLESCDLLLKRSDRRQVRKRGRAVNSRNSSVTTDRWGDRRTGQLVVSSSSIRLSIMARILLFLLLPCDWIQS